MILSPLNTSTPCVCLLHRGKYTDPSEASDDATIKFLASDERTINVPFNQNYYEERHGVLLEKYYFALIGRTANNCSRISLKFGRRRDDDDYTINVGKGSFQISIAPSKYYSYSFADA